jgi:DNA repair protein RecO
VKHLHTKGIVLSRTDYGEADRIVTLLTPDYGKLRLMAKGVRKIKSKMAGGLELLSISDISFIRGKGDVGTLVSSRLITHFGNIVKDIDRVQLAYECLKLVNQITADEPEAEYFSLLAICLAALNNENVGSALISAWYEAQLLKLAGHMPDLHSDDSGQKLLPDHSYNFNFDHMHFVASDRGGFSSSEIKSLRLLFSHNLPRELAKVKGIENTLNKVKPLVHTMLNSLA